MHVSAVACPATSSSTAEPPAPALPSSPSWPLESAMAACASRSLAVSAMRVAPGPLVTRETRRSVSLRLREWRKSKLAAAASLFKRERERVVRAGKWMCGCVGVWMCGCVVCGCMDDGHGGACGISSIGVPALRGRPRAPRRIKLAADVAIHVATGASVVRRELHRAMRKQ